MALKISRKSLQITENELIRKLTIKEAMHYVPGLRRQPAPGHVEFFTMSKTEIRVPLWFGVSELGITPEEKPEIDIRLKDSVSFRGAGDDERDQKKMLEEAMVIMERERVALLHIPTGRGKTMMSIAASCEHKKLTLVLVERKLVIGWKKAVDIYTTGSCWVPGPRKKADVVWSILRKQRARNKADGSSRDTHTEKSLNKESLVSLRTIEVEIGANADKRKPPDSFTHIICTPGMIKGIPCEVLSKVGFLVIDEVDHFYTKNRLGLILSACPEYVLMCSATPFGGGQGYHKSLKVMMGPEGSVFRPETDPYTFVCINTGISLREDVEEAGGKWQSILFSQATNSERNAMVLKWIKKFPEVKEKILTFCWLYRDHIPGFVGLLAKEGIDHAWYAKSKKTYKDSHVVVTTIAKGGVGFDQEAACEDFDGNRFTKMIMTGTVKKIDLFVQMKGRLVGRSVDPWIFCFVDENTCIRRHIRAIRSHVRKNENATYIELNWDDELPEIPEEILKEGTES